MLFNSFEFILLFLPTVLAVYFLLNRFSQSTAAKIWLVVASLFFYSVFNLNYSILIIGSIIFVISALVVLNFESLFGLVVDFTTVYSQPLLGVMLCIFAGWIWHRDNLLQEVQRGHADIENTLFWKVWPFYVRFFCPVLILAAFIQSVTA